MRRRPTAPILRDEIVIVNAEEVARLHNVTERDIESLADRGLLVAFRAGGERFFYKNATGRALREHAARVGVVPRPGCGPIIVQQLEELELIPRRRGARSA